MATRTPGSIDQENKKSKKPRDTKFKQQKLPAWQPILTAGTVLPAFFAIGVSFLPLGAVLLVASNNIKEFSYDYTQCVDKTTNATCSSFLEDKNNTIAGRVCTCDITFTLDEDFTGKVYMYYGLSNFYQNHRRYVKSRDDNQLHGDVTNEADLNSDCDPYISNGSFGYAPCGAIANSLFNDTFTVVYNGESGGQNTNVSLIATGIAWYSDRNVKFKNPSTFDGFTHPPNWHKDVQNLGSGSNKGFQNEDLIVWMRTAALPTFRKLWRKIDHAADPFKDGLPKGEYTVTVSYAYPVTSFDGTKRFILTTTSWLGGKNSFLGIAYLVVGCICVLMAVVFLFIHIKWGKNVQHESSHLLLWAWPPSRHQR